MVSGNKDKSNIYITSICTSVRDPDLVRINDVVMGSIDGLRIFCGLVFIVDFYWIPLT